MKIRNRIHRMLVETELLECLSIHPCFHEPFLQTKGPGKEWKHPVRRLQQTWPREKEIQGKATKVKSTRGSLVRLVGPPKRPGLSSKPPYLLGFHVWNEETKGAFVCTTTPFLFLSPSGSIPQFFSSAWPSPLPCSTQKHTKADSGILPSCSIPLS